MPRLDLQLVAGMDRSAPAHFLHQEGLSRARVLNNLRPDRGELARRPAMVSTGVSGPTRDGLAGTFPVVHLEELSIEPGFRSRFLLATTRELYIYDEFAGAWFEITPTYTTGTVSVTNASATVTGSSTAWRTRGIYGAGSPLGNWFKGPDGAWYNIVSVASDTSLTLSTPYGGSTAAGQAYTIKRTLFLTPDAQDLQLFLHTWRINEDLYVAGQVSGTYLTGFGAESSDGGVLKVVGAYNIFQTSFSSGDTSFIFSGNSEAEAGIDFPGDSIRIYGFGGLADGRLVLAAQAFDDSTGFAAGARIYYSSHLDVAVWTTSPGGATDLIDYRGAITGASFSTTNVLIHFEDGVEVADLTGEIDPPLRFRPSRATGLGAVGPRMIARVPQGRSSPGSELFIGSDLALYAWNGIGASPVEARGFVHETSEGGSEIAPEEKVDARSGVSVVDFRRSEVAFFIPFGTLTREIRFNYDTGEIWRGTYSGKIYAAMALGRSELDGLGWEFDPPGGNLLLGTDTATSWYWQTSEIATSDAYSGGGDTGGIYALFEGIDAGKPETTKVTQEILVYLRAPFHATPASTTLKLRWWSDSVPAGEALTAAAVVPTRTAYENDAVRPEYVAIFNAFDEKPWRSLSFVVASNDDNVFAATISRISVFYSDDTGDVRAG